MMTKIRIVFIMLFLTLVLCPGSKVRAQEYLNDGALQNASGGWSLPDLGSCKHDPTKTSRPECLALRFPAYTDSASCTAAGYSWRSGCNYPAATDEATCVAAGGIWSNGVCALSLKNKNRNSATCTQAGGVWVAGCTSSWEFTGVYNPPLKASTDQCIRCHNTTVQYNSVAERWVDTFLKTGHKGMAKKVTPGLPWAGPDGTIYPTDSSLNLIDWTNGRIRVGGTDRTLYWIFGDWLAPLPRSIYATGPGANQRPGLSYSCGRCHMTGWTSDATIKTTKLPERDFPGVTWDGVTLPAPYGTVNLASGMTGDTNPASSWDAWGITCSRCHDAQYPAPPGGSSHHDNLTSNVVASGSNGYCSLARYSNQTGCENNGGTWFLSTTYSCTLNGYYTQADCEGNGGTWRLARERKGQMITRLCMDCHRQETGGYPYDSNNPAGALKVGPAHGTVGFVSHPAGNQFLNSPHGKFTGTFAEISTATFGNGYNSYFQFEGRSPNTGNGCTGCHNVHQSVVPETGHREAISVECTECHAKQLKLMLHPFGPGTPYENMATKPAEACVICHMPEMSHLFRINTDEDYFTYPLAAMTGVTNANTAPDGSYTNAVWNDVDLACGQCHGGGSNNWITTGSINAGTKTLTVSNAFGISAGNKIKITGAGALGADFETYVASVSGNTVTLAGNASTTVSSVRVEQNPVKNKAAYLTKVQLAKYAEGIHNDAPYVSFSHRLDPANPLTVTVDATGSLCSGRNDNCDAFVWEWGDGTPNGSGVIATHTYATPGTKYVTLTVHEYGVSSGSLTKAIQVYGPDWPPTVSSNFTFNANTWTATLIDTSTDNNGVHQVTVNWGDGSVLSVGAAGQTFTHTYLNAGNYTITHKAIDTIGQISQEILSAAPAYFTISGTIYQSNGTTPVASAMIQVKKGTQVVRTVYSGANGTFLVGSLKPATYTLYVTKYGYTFNVPAATITVGPSSAGNNIVALTPLTKFSGVRKNRSEL